MTDEGHMLKAPGHVPMTRDAMLVTAQDVAARNNVATVELAAEGVSFSPDLLVERRLEAALTMLLDDDQRAILELVYQEKLEAFLSGPDVAQAVEQARRLNTQAKLAHPSTFDAAARPGGPLAGSLLPFTRP